MMTKKCINKKKITIKEILEDNWDEFKRKMWYRVPSSMREHVDNIVHKAKRALKDTKQAVKYIGRYLARAAIAEYRIEEYDGRNVIFWYEDHDDGKQVRVTLEYSQGK